MEKEYIQLPALKRDLDPDVVRERCFWLPGIYLLIEISFYCCQKVFMSIARIYERLNSTHVGVNSTACPSGRWNLLLKFSLFWNKRTLLFSE